MTNKEIEQRLETLSEDIGNFLDDQRTTFPMMSGERGKRSYSVVNREKFLEHCLEVLQRDIHGLQEDLHN